MWRRDWPRRNAPIDPAVDDLPHPDCGAERWYFHCHLIDAAGAGHGLVVAFVCHRGESTPDGYFTLAGRTGESGGHDVEVWYDRGALETLRSTIDQDPSLAPGVREAYLEQTACSIPISPDRLLTGEVTTAADQLNLGYGEVSSLRKLPDGAYRVTFRGERLRFDLTLRADKPPVPQGFDHGRVLSRFRDHEDELFSYCTPRLRVSGHVDDTEVAGTGWYEHMFGGGWYRPERARHSADRSWNWCGIQLDSGHEVAVALLEQVDPVTRQVTQVGTAADVYTPAGGLVNCAATIIPTAHWTSLSTLNTYPTAWTISVPEQRLDLIVELRFPQQELRTVIAHGAFLEGWATVHGTMAGAPVSGKAFGEVMPANRYGRMEDYLRGLHSVTQAEIRVLYPDAPSEELTASLTGLDVAGHPHSVVHDAIVRPLRHITDPAGRGWRTFAICAAIEMLDARADPYRALLAVVEITHSGSMIVDDIGDESVMRRGVPAAHLAFGAATAMNAGTAAYFTFDRIADQVLPDDDRLKLRAHRAFLRGLRSAHVGQGIDIAGHQAAMDLALSTGDATALLDAVRAGMRLKSGAPARAFAEVGALIGGASDEQFVAIGAYFEAVGLAYQITDDVLDVTGVLGRASTKHRGEDLRAGKVSMPLAHAVGRLPEITAVWPAVRDGKADDATIHDIAEQLVACGAVQACYDEARTLVDTAWAALEPLLPSTFMKVMTRALGSYAAMREPEHAASA